VWDVATGAAHASIGARTDMVFQLAVSPQGDRLITTEETFRLSMWEISTGRRIWAQPLTTLGIQPVAFSPDGKLVASAVWSRPERWNIAIWDAATGALQAQTELEQAAVVALRFTPNGDLSAATNDGVIHRLTTRPLRAVERRSWQPVL
jgi:WD40 repeat protein